MTHRWSLFVIESDLSYVICGEEELYCMSCAQAVCVMEGGTHGAGTASKVWLHHSLESVHAQHCLMQASRVRWAGFEAVGTELGGKQPCSLLRTKLQSQTDFVDVW